MSPTGQKILTALKSASPPQSINDLVELTGVTRNLIFATIARLVKAGSITQDDLPWRKGRPLKRGGRASSGLTGIARAAKYISENAEKDSDRVSALRLLTEIQSMGGETAGPPPPGDTEGTIDALERIILAAGPKLLKLAIIRAYPTARVTLDAEEAVDAQTSEAPVFSSGTPAC
jgi:hypothetical protein